MAHLKRFHGTLVCRGTPVEKHCLPSDFFVFKCYDRKDGSVNVIFSKEKLFQLKNQFIFNLDGKVNYDGQKKGHERLNRAWHQLRLSERIEQLVIRPAASLKGNHPLKTLPWLATFSRFACEPTVNLVLPHEIHFLVEKTELKTSCSTEALYISMMENLPLRIWNRTSDCTLVCRRRPWGRVIRRCRVSGGSSWWSRRGGRSRDSTTRPSTSSPGSGIPPCTSRFRLKVTKIKLVMLSGTVTIFQGISCGF